MGKPDHLPDGRAPGPVGMVTGMNMARMLSGVGAVLAVPVIAAGVAQAVEPPSVDVAAGRHWMVVTVQPNSGDRPQNCRVDPYFGTPQTVSLPVPASGNLFVDNVRAGHFTVSAWCPNGGVAKAEVTVRD